MTIGSNMSYDPAHAKLRKKATKQLKQNTAEQLEEETKRMEERIRALKEQMVKEKDEREKYGGSRWTSSNKTGNLASNSQKVSKKKPIKAEKGPRKIKLLSDEPLSSYAKKTVLRESLNESFGSDLQCGQCEKTKATLACVECNENYCVSCFMGFHRKGALRSHTTKNLDQIGSGFLEEKGKTDPATQRFLAPAARKFQNGTSPESNTGGALLRGSYDEKESSESFAQALKEWRSNTTGKENNSCWLNPADKVSSVSCETNTVPEKLKPVEINLNFGSNKSLSYLDRLVLKKHRDVAPSTRSTSSRGKSKTNEARKKELSTSEKTNDDFGVNYREIFQSIGVHSARAKSSPNASYYGRSSVTIEEVTGPLSNTEETACCIVEEGRSNAPNVVNNKRAVPSRVGRVSILAMTPSGDFGEDPLRPSSFKSIRSLQSRQSPLNQTKLVSPTDLPRVWSPKPTYTGLSEFFLAGVKSPSPSGTPKTSADSLDAKSVSPILLAKGVWKPDDSVCIVEVTNEREEDVAKSSQSGLSFPVIPLVREPVDDGDSEKQSLKRGQKSMEKGNSLELEVDNMQDFGINDFLKAGPVPRKLSGDYDVHRVSTVSPLTLSPRPPQLHWSDDDSDDDVIVDVASRVPETTKDCDDKEEQDQDDRATMEDLTWELESTTGRLTHCEEDLDDSLDAESDDENNHSGDDSIEEDNGGISLDEDSEDEIDEHESSLQDSLMIEEVHALK